MPSGQRWPRWVWLACGSTHAVVYSCMCASTCMCAVHSLRVLCVGNCSSPSCSLQALFEYLFYHENNVRSVSTQIQSCAHDFCQVHSLNFLPPSLISRALPQALELASLATEACEFEDWWWKTQLGKCYYRYVSGHLSTLLDIFRASQCTPRHLSALQGISVHSRTSQCTPILIAAPSALCIHRELLGYFFMVLGEV